MRRSIVCKVRRIKTRASDTVYLLVPKHEAEWIEKDLGKPLEGFVKIELEV